MSSMYFNLLTIHGSAKDIERMIEANKIDDNYTFQAMSPEPSPAEMDEIMVHRMNEWGCSTDDLHLASDVFESVLKQIENGGITGDNHLGLVVDLATQSGPCDKWCKAIAKEFNLDVKNEYYSYDDQVFELVKYGHDKDGSLIESLTNCDSLSHLRYTADGYIEIDDYIAEFIDSEYMMEIGKMIHEGYNCTEDIVEDLEEELKWYTDTIDPDFDIEDRVQTYLIKILNGSDE